MRIILGSALVAALALAGCGSDGPKASGKPTVVAGFYPLAEAVARVAGDDVEVVNLTPPGVEPHDLELTTDQVDQVEDADLVVLLGGGFQPAIEEVAERRDGDTVLVLDSIRGLGGDPHVWLDPANIRALVDLVTDAVPGERNAVSRRALAYIAELEDLDQRFAAGLATCDRRTIVTAHAAFGWLAERYDLRQESIAGLAPEQEPDPRRLAELADLVEEEGVTTVFTEELVSPRVAKALAREAGVRTDVLDPLESLTKKGETYVSVMDDNLARLRRALGCH